MKNIPKITVLMTVYNGGRYLTASIESVLNQTFSDFEFLIINDSSSDDSVEVIRSFRDKRIIVHNNKENLGQTASLNVGLRLARGKYIARIDADDIAFPNWLKVQADFINNNPEYAVVSTAAVVIDGDGRINREYIPPASEKDILLRSLLDSPINHVGSVMNREIVLAHGGYDEGYKIIADYRLWSNLLRVGLRITSLPDTLVAIRVHSASSSIASGEGAYVSEWSEIISENIRYISSADVSDEDIRLLCKANYYAAGLSDDEFERAVDALGRIYGSLRPQFDFNTDVAKRWHNRQRRSICLKRLYFFIQEGCDLRKVRGLCSSCIDIFGMGSIFVYIFAVSLLGKNILRRLPYVYDCIIKLRTRVKFVINGSKILGVR